MMCKTFVSSATMEPPDDELVICSEECDEFNPCPCKNGCGWCDFWNRFVKAGDECGF